MVTVGTLTRVEIKPGNEAIIEHALQEAFSIVQQEPATTAWVAFRQGSSTFGVFDAFPDEAGRLVHLSNEQYRARLERVNSLLAQPRTTEMLQVLAAKLPAQGATRTVTVGFLSRFEAKSGKEAEIEPVLNGTLLAVQQLPATTAWFGFRQGPSTFGTLDLFLDEAGRQTHYHARWPQLQARASQMFVEGSLVIEKVDVLLAKLPS
jgi:quinol monooxygenase YgiN